MNSQQPKNDISQSDGYKAWINYLKTKIWAWMIGGIFVMYVLLQVTQWLIIFIGGMLLGLYMFQNWGPGSQQSRTEGKIKHIQKGWNFVKGSVDTALGTRERFDNYKNQERASSWADKGKQKVGKLFWATTRG